MVYGQISEYQKINAFIYRCFDELVEVEQRKFVKKFREQPHDQNQVMHTLRELVCGAYLSSKGYRVIHDYHLKDRTPDWCILDDNDSIQTIIEVTNFHIDQVTERYIENQRQSKTIIGYWPDGNTNNRDRLYERIQQKAQVYKELVNSINLPYVIAVYPDYRVCLEFDDVYDCLSLKNDGIYDLYPQVSGVLFYVENDGQYTFRYISNPRSLRKLDLPEGYFP